MSHFKLNLSSKGMILIAIPVMLQLVFLLTYSRMLQQAATTTRLQYTSKEIFTYANWLGVLVLGSALSCADYTLTGDKIAQADYRLYKIGIPKELQLLKTYLQENQSERQAFEKLQQLTDSIVTLLDNDMRLGITAPAAPVPDLKLQQIWSIWKNILNQRKVLLSEYKTRHTLRPEDLPSVQETIGGFVSIGVVLSVVMAFVLFWGFSKGITERLSILAENAARLTRRQELRPPVSGEDEISNLDQVFHATAEALLAAEQRKQEFVDMISHDLKTPLASLQGLLALVSAGSYGSLSETGKQRVVHAEQDVIRLIKLINELLDVEKMSSGVLEYGAEPIKLSALIEQAVESIRPFADRASVVLVTESAEQEVIVDQERIVQVIVNLLSNAIKYSQAGSAVQISAERLGDKIRVSVKDEGCGIPETDTELIFDRFRQAKRSSDQKREGTGLGLAICKAIIEAHGGRVGVLSKEGAGSTFWFELPASVQKHGTLDINAG